MFNYNIYIYNIIYLPWTQELLEFEANLANELEPIVWCSLFHASIGVGDSCSWRYKVGPFVERFSNPKWIKMVSWAYSEGQTGIWWTICGLSTGVSCFFSSNLSSFSFWAGKMDCQRKAILQSPEMSNGSQCDPQMPQNSASGAMNCDQTHETIWNLMVPWLQTMGSSACLGPCSSVQVWRSLDSQAAQFAW